MGDVHALPKAVARDLTVRLPVTALDFAIIDLLPDEGSLLGKYHPQGRTVKDLVRSLDDPYTKSSTVNARMRVLKLNGLAVDVKAGAKKRVWQRTPKGVEYRAQFGPREEE